MFVKIIISDCPLKPTTSDSAHISTPAGSDERRLGRWTLSATWVRSILLSADGRKELFQLATGGSVAVADGGPASRGST